MLEYANDNENREDIESNLPIPNEGSLVVLELRIIAKTNMNGGFCYLALDQTNGRILRPIFNNSPGQCCWSKKGVELELDNLYNFRVIAHPDHDMYSTPFPHCNEDLIVADFNEEFILQPPLPAPIALLAESDIQAISRPQVSYSMPFLHYNEDMTVPGFENGFASLLSPQPALQSLLLPLAKSDVQDIFLPNVIKEHRYVDENTLCSSAGILRSNASIEYNESKKNKYYCKVKCVSGTYNMPVKVIDIGDIDTKHIIYPDALIVLGLGRPLKGRQGKYPPYCPARCFLLVVGIYPLQKQNGQPLNQSCMTSFF